MGVLPPAAAAAGSCPSVREAAVPQLEYDGTSCVSSVRAHRTALSFESLCESLTMAR